MREKQRDNNGSNKLTRRNFLDRMMLTMAGGAAIIVAGTRRAVAKVTQKSVNYQATPSDGKKCETCALYQGNGKCAAVDGTVAAAGYCKLYAPK